MWRELSEERGNVESSLVLIPLLFLFLVSTQLILAIGMRDAESLAVANEASTRAISGRFLQSDEEASLESRDRFSNISLLIARRTRAIPELIPGLSQLLGKRLETDVKGIAIIENTR